MRRRRDLPAVDEVPESPRAELALLHLRGSALGMTTDRPPPEPGRSAFARLLQESERLGAAGWPAGARLAAVLDLADELGIGDRVRPMVQRVTAPDAGVGADPAPHRDVS